MKKQKNYQKNKGRRKRFMPQTIDAVKYLFWRLFKKFLLKKEKKYDR